MKLSEKLKKLRNEKGKTQQQASDEMKIAISSLRNYENGKIPDTTQLKIIKNYYKVTYEYLLDDECENRMNETVDIGKTLNLSDESIQVIKNIKEDKILNVFFEHLDFESFIENLDLYYKIQKILNYDLSLIIHICDIWEYILDRNEKNKQEDLKDYFDKCDNAVYNIVNFTENTPFFDPSDSKYDLFENEYESLKNYIFNEKIINGREDATAQNELESLLDLFDEIYEKYKMYSKIIKLNINDIINGLLHRFEKMYNVTLGSEDYTKMFGKYIKYINSDIREDYRFYSKRFKMNKII